MLNDDGDLVDFEAQARRIRSALRAAEKAEAAAKRRGQPGLRPAHRPEGVLLVQCYRYFRQLKRAGQLEALAAHLSSDRHSRWQRHKRVGVDNVLRLIERPGKPWLVTPSRRGRIVEQLEFADRFDIHSALLIAFLYEAGPHDRIVQAQQHSDAPAWIEKYQHLSMSLKDKRAQRLREPEAAPAT